MAMTSLSVDLHPASSSRIFSITSIFTSIIIIYYYYYYYYYYYFATPATCFGALLTDPRIHHDGHHDKDELKICRVVYVAHCCGDDYQEDR